MSLYERKSRLGLLYLMPDKSSDGTFKGIVSLLLGMEVRTITYDNGLEFARHGLINELLGCESYFCKPSIHGRRAALKTITGW